MLDGWPDGLYCGESTEKNHMMYLTSVTIDTILYKGSWSGDTDTVEFNSDKTWLKESGINIPRRIGCKNKSIDTLIAENKAIYFSPSKIPSSLSILNSRPDAIYCGNGMIFYAWKLSTTSESEYKTNDGLGNYLKFNEDSDGTFKARNTEFVDSEECDGKSLKKLYDECKAFNFVTSKPNNITGENTDEKPNKWPIALDCSDDSNVKNIFYIEILSNKTKELVYSRISDTEELIFFNPNGTF